MGLIDRQEAIKELASLIHYVEGIYGNGEMSEKDCRDFAHFVLDRLPSAEPERKIFEEMSDTEFEKWLSEHGICNPDIHESISCSIVPLLIDNAINELSAEPEIIRCKDCKHRDPEDKKCDCGHDILWQLPRQNDWYCADAERRNDE